MNKQLTLKQLQALLERARTLPYFQVKYRDVPALQSVDDLVHIPVMDKHDIIAAADDIRKQALRTNTSPVLFSSGGSTGKPKLSFIPAHFFLTDILSHWQPLTGEDVLLNLFMPGKLWSAHYFYNQLARESSACVIPMGALAATEYGAWFDFFERQGITALATTPTTLKELLGYDEMNADELPALRKILWVGEVFPAVLADTLRERFPDIQIYGLYGSTETWVIGYNTPRDNLDTFHVLPYQVAELTGDGDILVTNTHSDCLNVLLRYQMQDTGRWMNAEQTCLQVLGRSDQAFKFRGALVFADELIDLARHLDVQQAQIVIRSHAADSHNTMEFHVQDAQSAFTPDHLQRIRAHLLSHSLDINNLFTGTPDDFQVIAVDDLQTNPRTRKTPLVLWKDDS
jgi:phenylacetate-CoA ligase